MLSFIISSRLIDFVSFYYIVEFNHFFSLTRSLLVPNVHVSIESIDHIRSSPFQLQAILLIFSLKTLFLLLLNLCCVFNNDSLFLMRILLWFFTEYLCEFNFFLDKLSCF